MSRRDCPDWDYGDSDKDLDEELPYCNPYPRHYSSDRERAYDRCPSRRQRGDRGERRHRDGECYGSSDVDRDRHLHPQRRGGYEGERSRYCPREDYRDANRRDYDGGRREFDRRDSRDEIDLRCQQERRPRQAHQEKESELRRRGCRDHHGGNRHGNKDTERSPRVQTTVEHREEPPLPPIPKSRSQEYCGRQREYGSPQLNDQDPRMRSDLCPPENKPIRSRQLDDSRGRCSPPLEPVQSRGKCLPTPEPVQSRGKCVPTPEPVQSRGKCVPTPEPVQSLGKCVPTPEPVQSLGKCVPTPEPVQSRGKCLPTPEPVQSRGKCLPTPEPVQSRGKCVPTLEPAHSRGKCMPAPEPAITPINLRHDSPLQVQQQVQQQSQQHIQQQQPPPPPRKENPPQEQRGGRLCGKSIPLIHCNLGEWRLDRKIGKKKHTSYTVLKEDEGGIPRHASVLLPVLEESERIFHELVAAGDVEPTRAFLQDHPDFNINCVNYHKISAFHVAVKQQNEAMVEFLLQQKNLDIADGALYAIKAGNLRIVEMIFERICELSPGLEFAGTTHSVDFADDLTPIVLAAQLGNYEIINFLIKRGHTIPPVHPPFCKCEACRADLQKYDRLRYSTMKLNLYKAICNPMYIFHTTDDPFQRAFELVKELEDAATVFPQFKVSFEDLWQSLRKFTTELIGCCRNAQEVEIILKKSPNCVADHVKFPRLQYAIDLKQKEFVSHPYTQAVLGDAWTGELLEWKIRSPLMQSLSVLPRIPMLPIMTAMCILLPNHSLVRKWKTPVNKMISSVASYLIFLIVIFLESNLDKKGQKRGPPNSGLEGIIIIYVIGYIWLNIRICFKQGIKRFFSTMWHWYDTIMLFLFTMTIVFWIASWVDITANDDIDLPRKYWNAMDPELIAEGFFAVAVIMAFFRLNLFLSLNYHLGPLQVSIGKMTLDIFRFIIIFVVIILAWCAGLCRFYQPYEGMVQKDAASGNTTTQVPSFVNFLMTLKTFFWAIFGMSPIESADVVIENLPGDTPGTTIINKHQFTEAVGYIAFALFQFLSVVVVLNMLVACMANTFTKVIDNVTVEWVFGRSQVYLSFMASSMLPPPFNLVPTGAGLKDMFRWFRLLAKPSDGQKARCSLAHCCYIESETEAYVNNEFPSLMSELAQRYIRFKSELHEEERTTLDDIRNEINEVKECMRKLAASGYYRTC